MTTKYTQYRLQPDERPRLVYEYYVTGHGVFPTDMLRFDSAWPARGEDAAKMERQNAESMLVRNRRSIRMRSYREPTVDRWISFGWSVGTVDLSEVAA